MDNSIMAANERQVYFTNDEEEIRAYEMREMALMDERARIQFGVNEGLAKGLTQGRKEGQEAEKIKIARNALTEGASIEFVQKITGLDLETIKRLNE